MASTYTTSNKLDKQGVGDNSATWGVVLNTDLNLIDSSLDAKTSVALSGTTSTMTLLDGAASDIRSRVIVFTGSLSANHTVTVAPNTMPKWWIMKNQTTGGFSVIISQGSGSTATIPFGSTWATVIADGAGSGAAVVTVDAPYFSGDVSAGSFSGSGANLTNLTPDSVDDMSHVRATTSVAQAIPNSTPTIIVFGTEEYDTQAAYNPTTGRFVAPYTGYYRISATIHMAQVTTPGLVSLAVSIYKNGTIYASSPGIVETITGQTMLATSADTTMALSFSDYVEIFVTQSTGGSLALDGLARNNYLTVDRIV